MVKTVFVLRLRKAMIAVYPEWYVSCDQVARAKSNNGNEEFRDLPICKFTSGEGGGRGERGRPGEGDVRGTKEHRKATWHFSETSGKE